MMIGRLAAFALASALGIAAQAGGRDFTPASDAQVIETLGPRVRVAQASPEAAAQAARQAITQARETADPRYLGRAQAALAPWWDKDDAPSLLAVLQATVQQSHHRFGDRHVHTQVLSALRHGMGAVDAFGHMAERIDRLLQRQALGQQQADLTVAAQVAGGGQHQVAQTAQAHEGVSPRPQGQAKPRHLCQAPGDERGPRVLAERQAIDQSIAQALTALDLLIAGDMERAMLKIHARPPRPKKVIDSTERPA